MSSNTTDTRLPRNRVATSNHSISSPRTGAASAPVNHDASSYRSSGSGLSSPRRQSSVLSGVSDQRSLLSGQLSARSLSTSPGARLPTLPYGRSSSIGYEESSLDNNASLTLSPQSPSNKKVMSVASTSLAKARARSAQKENDAMVYLDGPQVYTCAQCRTHLTSHDDIISKSFHGRHGRAYLFDQCVNVTIGKAEDRLLITGLHSVCDIFCKRCKNLVGWTYAKAYETSQKYKEGKFIIEKINLHLEESPNYDVAPPAGERSDRWRRRSMSWGSEIGAGGAPLTPRGERSGDVVYEYSPSFLPSGEFHRRQGM